MLGKMMGSHGFTYITYLYTPTHIYTHTHTHTHIHIIYLSYRLVQENDRNIYVHIYTHIQQCIYKETERAHAREREEEKKKVIGTQTGREIDK